MLSALNLTNFRSYKEQSFDFEQVTVFIGRNGVGKTNILEAVSFLALARSFRTRIDKEVIYWGESVARVVGKLDSTSLEIAIANQPTATKIVRVNGVNRRPIELLGHLSVVIFLPESLRCVDGPPHLRRQFLDLLLIQEDRRYAYHLLQLQKVLRQRNRLLRQINDGLAGADQLVFWDESLIEHGAMLTAKRTAALVAINASLGERYGLVSKREEILNLRYRSGSVSESSGEQKKYYNLADCPQTTHEWAIILKQSLERYQGREIASGRSLYGPQRDDFDFMLMDRPLATFGSRGEFRSAILALKAREAEYLLTSRSGSDTPLVFLLDDVYSELDVTRRQQLTKLIGDHQAIITTTEISHLDTAMREAAKIIDLETTETERIIS